MEQDAKEQANMPLLLADMSESSASFNLSSTSFTDDLLSKSGTFSVLPSYDPSKPVPDAIMEDVT